MDFSVICPFYNEADGIEQATRQMLAELERLPGEWELILVNDGSSDASFALAARVAELHPRLRVLGYPDNRGRGHALRIGMEESRGAILITTEIDLSWGEDIVRRLLQVLRENQHFDMVVACPHLAGGGFRGVPPSRVWLSQLANLFTRAFMPGAIRMNTGMTRAYRRRAALLLPLREDSKTFHVEVIAKAHAIGLVILEVPAVVTWHDPSRARRRHRWGLFEMALSHIGFVLRTSPAPFACALGVAALLVALASLLLAGSAAGGSGGADGSAPLPLLFFYAALASLALTLPLAWVGARIRRAWRAESEALATALDAQHSTGPAAAQQSP